MPTRRDVLQTALCASAGLAIAGKAAGKGDDGPRIAAIVTEWRKWSHADVILPKFLEGLEYQDIHFRPRSKIVSLYTDQVPEKDLSRPYAEKHKLPIFPSIAGALTLGTDRLAVDGVLIVAEHGQYPYNEKGQHLYPRRRFFEETAVVIRRSGRAIPIFSDKHLSSSWKDAKWIYDTARELKLPFMAGSSLPLTWRRPDLIFPLGVELMGALAVGYHEKDAYGFHALEMLQCMVERRRGGEAGVKSIEGLSGEAVWKAGDAGRWSWDLLHAAIARAERPTAGEVRERVKEPSAVLIEYLDGFRASMLMMDGKVGEFLFAAQVKGRPEPVSTLFWLQEPDPFAHFALLADSADQMFVSGKPTYAVERTLLTTGILDRWLTALHEGDQYYETPELAISYQPPKQARRFSWDGGR